MLDENLPTFYLDAAKDNVAHHKTYYLTRGGGDPEPVYRLDNADPALAASKNAYSVGLFDPYNPDVLYGEVLVRPEWSQPSLSQEDIRRNGGVPPPPEPLMPEEFTIQLYNPDQQVVVRHKTSTFVGTSRWEFSMPQNTFRLPSGSQLDRSQNDPAADANTPKVNFVWKRETALKKEIHCYMVGKSTDVVHKKKSKEADITVALFRSLREVTIYEPNLYRVEMEDPKGLEVVLLLGAATIRDIWFGNFRQVFNISESSRRKSSATGEGRPEAAVLQKRDGRSQAIAGPPAGHAAIGGLYQTPPAGGSVAPRPPARSPNRPPPMDPRSQWEVDSETARLQAQVRAEEKELRKREEARRREQARLDEEETKRLRKMVEEEERQRLKHEKEVEKETKRLQKLYGNQQLPQTSPPPPASAPMAPVASGALPVNNAGRPASQYPQFPVPHAPNPALPPRPAHNSPYLQANAHEGQGGSSSSSRLSGIGGSVLDFAERYKLNKKKSSAF